MENNGWIDVQEAVSQAKDIVITIIVTLFFIKKEPITFVVEVGGIDEMFIILQKLEGLETKKIIKTFNIHNLTSLPALNLESFKKVLDSVGK